MKHSFKNLTATFTCLLLSKDARKSFTVVISCVSQEYPERKSWFKFVRMLCFEMREDMTADDMFQDLTWFRCWKNWPVIFLFVAVSFFERS